MKVAVASTLPVLNSSVGRELENSKYLLIVNIDTAECESILNPLFPVDSSISEKTPAQQLLEKDILKVLVGNCSPDIREYLGHAGIQVIVGVKGPVHNAIKQLREVCLADTVIMTFEDICG